MGLGCCSSNLHICIDTYTYIYIYKSTIFMIQMLRVLRKKTLLREMYPRILQIAAPGAWSMGSAASCFCWMDGALESIGMRCFLRSCLTCSWVFQRVFDTVLVFFLCFFHCFSLNVCLTDLIIQRPFWRIMFHFFIFF